jgi:hypothetical protein
MPNLDFQALGKSLNETAESLRKLADELKFIVEPSPQEIIKNAYPSVPWSMFSARLSLVVEK